MSENNNGAPQPYQSDAEIAADMTDERYTSGDPEFHAYVDARLAAAPAPAPAPPPVQPFADRESMWAAKNDPRYETDREYRAEVVARIQAFAEGEVDAVTEPRVQRVVFDGKSFRDENAAQEQRLQEQHEAEFNRRLPVHVPGKGDVLPITSREELVSLVSSRDYQVDETFREHVALRLSVSTIV